MTERGLLGAVYDCTIAYPDTKPSTEMAVLRGELPSQVGVLPAHAPAPVFWWLGEPAPGEAPPAQPAHHLRGAGEVAGGEVER